MTTPAWYFDDIGHRYKRIPYDYAKGIKQPKAKCAWCGCNNKWADSAERRRFAHKTIRVCIDRQAMLFIGDGKGVAAKYGLGWTLPEAWPLRWNRKVGS